jgi:RNA polymerase sigma-70 factor (ECF subfamily)
MEPDADLETLMVRYQLGDLASATALIRRLSPQLHRFFMVQSVSRKDADDLLQETWMRIHEVRQTYRRGERVLPWLYAIARHVRVDHYRRVRRSESRERSVPQLPELPAGASPSTATPDIVELLAVLPESQREVITMLKISSMSLEEVARATSSSVGAVKQKAHRGYSRLRDILTRMGFNRAGSGDPHDR